MRKDITTIISQGYHAAVVLRLPLFARAGCLDIRLYMRSDFPVRGAAMRA
jgi:hypothetical protein